MTDFSDLKKPKSAPGDFTDLAEPKKQGWGEWAVSGLKNQLASLKHFPDPQEAKKEMESPENLNEMMINLMPAAQGMKLAGKVGPTLGKSIKSVFTKVAPRSWVERVQQGHDLMKGKAEDMFNFIKDQIPSRKIPNMEMSENLLNEAEQHLPDTRATKKLIGNARSGDYNAVHKLQSDLGRRGFGRLASEDYAQRDVGEEILDTRDKLLEQIKSHFNDTGNEDLSNTLDKARDQWRNLKDIYYGHPKVAQMVEQDTRLVPKNPENIFSEESVPMKKVLDQHPEIPQELHTMNTANRFINNLKKKSSIGLGLTTAAGGLYTGNKILDYIKNLNQEKQ